MNLFEEINDDLSHKVWKLLVQPENAKFRTLCNKLYDRYSQYSDSDFAKKFRVELYPAFWEMDLACTLMKCRKRFSDSYCGDEGPDICLLDGNSDRIWVEAICATRGTTDDAVSLGVPNETVRILSEKIMLRITSAICDKHRKHKEYLENEVCSENEPYVIAINGSLLTPGPGLDDLTPRIVKAVFGGGCDKFLYSGNNGNVSDWWIEHRPSITKYNQENISTGFFREKEYSSISALIYSESSIWVRPSETGSDYIVVRNPLAKNPLSKGFLGIGTEYAGNIDPDENVQLTITKYRKKEYLYKET